MSAPIVGAPLAGGPSTPALAAAVSEAGGIGFLAAGYKTAAAAQAELQELRALTSREGRLVLLKPQPNVADVLMRTQIDQVIPVCSDLAAARTAVLATG